MPIIFWIPVLIILGMRSLAMRPAFGHEWFNGIRDPITKDDCCDGTHCLPIDPEDIQLIGSTYMVRWRDGQIYTIDAKRAMPTQDEHGRVIACIWGGQFRCLFIPFHG